MSQEKVLNNIELEKSTSRRSRKDEEGRDYQCGCGKRYLSYPALYTHIKTKHEGRQPEGTQKTGSNMMAKRPKGKSQDQNFKNLLHLVDRQDVRLLCQLEQSMLGSVVVSNRIRRESVPKDIYQYYLYITKQSELILTKKSCLDMVLTVYLWNVGQYVNQKLYQYYLVFGKLLRNCYAEFGEEIYERVWGRDKDKDRQREGRSAGQEASAEAGNSGNSGNSNNGGIESSINIQQVRYVPIICDFLLRYYIPYCEQAKEYRDINLSLMQLMLTDFCLWLFKKKLTNIQISLQKEYKLETKPVPLIKHRISNKDSHKEKENKESSLEESQKRLDDNQSDDDEEDDDEREHQHLQDQTDKKETKMVPEEEEKEKKGRKEGQRPQLTFDRHVIGINTVSLLTLDKETVVKEDKIDNQLKDSVLSEVKQQKAEQPMQLEEPAEHKQSQVQQPKEKQDKEQQKKEVIQQKQNSSLREQQILVQPKSAKPQQPQQVEPSKEISEKVIVELAVQLPKQQQPKQAGNQ